MNRQHQLIFFCTLIIIFVVLGSAITYLDFNQEKEPYTFTGTLVAVQNTGDTALVSFSDGTVIRIWTTQQNVMEYWINKTIRFEYVYVNQDIAKLSNIREVYAQ